MKADVTGIHESPSGALLATSPARVCTHTPEHTRATPTHSRRVLPPPPTPKAAAAQAGSS